MYNCQAKLSSYQYFVAPPVAQDHRSNFICVLSYELSVLSSCWHRHHCSQYLCKIGRSLFREQRVMWLKCETGAVSAGQQNRSDAKNNILNSLAAVIHKNRRMRPEIPKMLCAIDLELLIWMIHATYMSSEKEVASGLPQLNMRFLADSVKFILVMYRSWSSCPAIIASD